MEKELDGIYQAFTRFQAVMEKETWDDLARSEACKIIQEVITLKGILTLYAGHDLSTDIVDVIYDSVFKQV